MQWLDNVVSKVKDSVKLAHAEFLAEAEKHGVEGVTNKSKIQQVEKTTVLYPWDKLKNQCNAANMETEAKEAALKASSDLTKACSYCKEQILKLSSSNRTFLEPPPDDEFEFVLDENIAQAQALLKIDSKLESARFKLVRRSGIVEAARKKAKVGELPRFTTEICFWRSYFYRVSTIVETLIAALKNESEVELNGIYLQSSLNSDTSKIEACDLGDNNDNEGNDIEDDNNDEKSDKNDDKKVINSTANNLSYSAKSIDSSSVASTTSWDMLSDVGRRDREKVDHNRVSPVSTRSQQTVSTNGGRREHSTDGEESVDDDWDVQEEKGAFQSEKVEDFDSPDKKNEDLSLGELKGLEDLGLDDLLSDIGFASEDPLLKEKSISNTDAIEMDSLKKELGL
eukprot:g4297.t1